MPNKPVKPRPPQLKPSRLHVNLWPDFKAEPRPRTVRRVLLEAGEGLAAQTEDQIRFVVDTKPGGKGRFVHDCYLVAPALSYRYPFCKVTEDGDPYPVTLVGDGTFQKGTSAGNEEAFVENLRVLFHSDATKRAVLRLLDVLS
jgi:hypothetical protein